MTFDVINLVAWNRGDLKKVTLELSGNSPLSDVVDAFETFLIAAGYQQSDVQLALCGSSPQT